MRPRPTETPEAALSIYGRPSAPVHRRADSADVVGVNRVLGMLGAAVVAGLAMTAVLLWRYDATVTAPGMRAYAASFDHPRTHAETLVVGMDGQAYGEIALDPAMTHAAARFSSPAEAAYREARPAYGWVAFIASAHGGTARVADSLLVLSVLSVSFLAAATALLAKQLGRPWAAGALVALLPGAAITAFSPGSADAFGCALAILALAFWLDERHRGAIVLFSFAALSRETLLLFPLSIAAWELWSRRPSLAMRLTIPVGVYFAWVAVVFIRIGALPFDNREGRFGLPFVGVFEAMGHWSPLSTKVAWSIVGLTIVAALRVQRPVLKLLVGTHVVLATLLGELVWRSWRDFSRVLLPLAVLGAVVCWPSTQADDARAGEVDDGDGAAATPSIAASRHRIAVPTASGG
jgi:hypothetical protein